MRYTQTTVVIGCDRCDTRVLESENAWGWLVAQTALSESPTATVTYHLCPACREALGTFMANESTDRPLIERLADILYPMDGYADDQWNGGDVCEALAELLREVAPWAEKRQPERPEDAYEAYRRERERLGL